MADFHIKTIQSIYTQPEPMEESKRQNKGAFLRTLVGLLRVRHLNLSKAGKFFGRKVALNPDVYSVARSSIGSASSLNYEDLKSISETGDSMQDSEDFSSLSFHFEPYEEYAAARGIETFMRPSVESVKE